MRNFDLIGKYTTKQVINEQNGKLIAIVSQWVYRFVV